MDFDLIFLSKAELKRLRALAKSGDWLLDTKQDSALINHGLVSHQRLSIDSTETLRFHCKINDNGRIFLARLDRDKRNKRSDRRHNWLIALFTTAAGAILSRPLWQLLDCINEFLAGIF